MLTHCVPHVYCCSGKRHQNDQISLADSPGVKMVSTLHDIPVGGTHSDTLRSQPRNRKIYCFHTFFFYRAFLISSFLRAEGRRDFSLCKNICQTKLFSSSQTLFFSVWFGLVYKESTSRMISQIDAQKVDIQQNTCASSVPCVAWVLTMS